MANLSNTKGIFVINLDELSNENIKKDEKLQRELLDVFKENVNSFYYGNVVHNIETDLKSDIEYSFNSNGRWSFYNTLKTFFEGFSIESENIKLNDFDGLTITFDYTDVDLNSNYFVDEFLQVKAVYIKEFNALASDFLVYDSTDLDVNAESLDTADEYVYDSFTPLGVKRIVEEMDGFAEGLFYDKPYLQEFIEEYPKQAVDTILYYSNKYNIKKVYTDMDLDDIESEEDVFSELLKLLDFKLEKLKEIDVQPSKVSKHLVFQKNIETFKDPLQMLFYKDTDVDGKHFIYTSKNRHVFRGSKKEFLKLLEANKVYLDTKIKQVVLDKGDFTFALDKAKNLGFKDNVLYLATLNKTIKLSFLDNLGINTVKVKIEPKETKVKDDLNIETIVNNSLFIGYEAKVFNEDYFLLSNGISTKVFSRSNSALYKEVKYTLLDNLLFNDDDTLVKELVNVIVDFETTIFTNNYALVY